MKNLRIFSAVIFIAMNSFNIKTMEYQTPSSNNNSSTITIEIPDIHTAARCGTRRDISRFLRDGVDPDSKNEGGDTPLHHAAARGNLDNINCLLRADANKILRNGLEVLEQKHHMTPPSLQILVHK